MANHPKFDEIAGPFAQGLVRRLLELARDEDLGPRAIDVTSDLVDASRVRAALRFREPGVVAGLAFADELLSGYGLGGRVTCDISAADGTRVESGDTAAVLVGPRPLVTLVERPILNLVGRLSGIATRTASFVERVRGTKAGVYDTRKTTPGLRVFEKHAVVCGGGRNHRMGLFDAVLIKDNHLAGVPLDGLADWIEQASRNARSAADERGEPLAFVQVEVDSLDQFDRVLACEPGAVDLVLLDNFEPEDLAEAVARRGAAGSSIRLEASGGVSLETVGAIARTGVERISVGSLTHGARSLDVGLDVDAAPAGA